MQGEFIDKCVCGMAEAKNEILVWLPSPMGDAVLCTPALRAIRKHFKSSRITFFANSVVRQVLSPCEFNDAWLEQTGKNPFAIAKMLKRHKFTHAILFKNSFASAMATFLAPIPARIGYCRQGRGVLLTDKLYPPKLKGKFKPFSMVDYYLAIASWLGAQTSDRSLELIIDKAQDQEPGGKLAEIIDSEKPIVVIVPGGKFGPSKCWLTDRFAQTADCLISRYGASVVISVSPEPAEKEIANQICALSKGKLINLAESPVSISQLKSLFSAADLVITNDTGPRHIAIALRRKVITLFGPNNPFWTDTGYEDEIKISGNVQCSPCDRPICKKSEHLCMQAITVEMVCEAAKKLLENNHKPISGTKQKFVEISKSFFVDADYEDEFVASGLTSVDAVFSFNKGRNLVKNNLAQYRSRLQFEMGAGETAVFMKRYDRVPIAVQIKNWFAARRRISSGLFDFEAGEKLSKLGIKTPRTIGYGESRGRCFEKKSFIITEKIPNAQSLEKRLPVCFTGSGTVANLKARRAFIARLGGFVKKFHDTNFRHRDLYFAHIFYSDSGEFYLIDLSRVFRPMLFSERFRIKDIAQVYYSAAGRYFSRTDRLRFYIAYSGQTKLTDRDKAFIRAVVKKANRMTLHDVKHGRTAPFSN